MANVFDEIRQVGKVAKPYSIVQGDTYLYFCMQPTQDTMVFQQVFTKKNISLISVYNIKDNVVGYLVQFKNKPVLDVSKSGEGVGIFFDNKTQHEKPKIVYSNSKLRVLSFSANDYYVALKWKSTAKEEA